jgi:acyl carrier protein
MTPDTSNVLELRVRFIVAQQLGVDEAQLAFETSLVEDLAADSLDLLELALTLETEFGIVVGPSSLDAVRTYGDLAATIIELVQTRGRHVPTFAKIRIISPVGLTLITHGLVLTPYEADAIREQALGAGRGSRLDLTLHEGTTDATLAAVRTTFLRLEQRGIDVAVRRQRPPGDCRVPPGPRDLIGGAATVPRCPVEHCNFDPLRNGDWAGFGREMEALGNTLEP